MLDRSENAGSLDTAFSEPATGNGHLENAGFFNPAFSEPVTGNGHLENALSRRFHNLSPGGFINHPDIKRLGLF